MTDLEQIDEFLENYKKVSPKKYYSEAQINEMFVKDFMDYRRSIMMNEKLSARQKAMILAGMIGAGGLTGGMTSCAQPTNDDTNIEETNEVTVKFEKRTDVNEIRIDGTSYKDYSSITIENCKHTVVIMTPAGTATFIDASLEATTYKISFDNINNKCYLIPSNGASLTTDYTPNSISM